MGVRVGKRGRFEGSLCIALTCLAEKILQVLPANIEWKLNVPKSISLAVRDLALHPR